MIRLLLTTLCLAGLSHAATLEWDAPAFAGPLTYRVYHGLAPRNYVEVTNVAGTSVPIVLSPGITHYFAITALSSNGLESDFSAELAVLRPPTVLQLRYLAGTNNLGTLTIEQSSDLFGWTTLTNFSLQSTAPRKFFRLAPPLTPAPQQ